MHVFLADGLVAPDPTPENGRREGLFAEGFVSAGASQPISKPSGSSYSGISLERFAKHLDVPTIISWL
jgi:hypothetical protein